MKKIIISLIALLSINLVAMNDRETGKKRAQYAVDRRERGKTSSCIHCIKSHLKCDYNVPCACCIRNNLDCIYKNFPIGFVDMDHLNASPVKKKKRGPYTKQVCKNCRTSHVKCDGKQPCDRCMTRNLECKFGQVKASGRKELKKPKVSPSSPEVKIIGEKPGTAAPFQREISITVDENDLQQIPLSQPSTPTHNAMVHHLPTFDNSNQTLLSQHLENRRQSFYYVPNHPPAHNDNSYPAPTQPQQHHVPMNPPQYFDHRNQIIAVAEQPNMTNYPLVDDEYYCQESTYPSYQQTDIEPPFFCSEEQTHHEGTVDDEKPDYEEDATGEPGRFWGAFPAGYFSNH